MTHIRFPNNCLNICQIINMNREKCKYKLYKDILFNLYCKNYNMDVNVKTKLAFNNLRKNYYIN